MRQGAIDIQSIRECIRLGNYFVKSHAAIHALKEGFDREQMVEAILNGKVIEIYPENQRLLICGQVTFATNTTVYLHVVCECADLIYVDIVTAYLPDEANWNHPPYSRRHKPKK